MNESLPQQTGFAALDDDGRREYWAALALRHTAGLGVRGACLLLKHFGSAYEAVTNVPAWPEAGVPAQKAEGYLNNAWRAAARPEWDAAHTLRASIILWTDKRYPPLLRELPDAPALLYAAGDASLLRAPCVAVVGSRDASSAAIDFTAAVAEELSAAGVTVVSGLAYGVDGYAHHAALGGPGRTIAVLPGGVDLPFPSGHRDLYLDVVEHGLAASEMPPGWVPGPGAFPVRNRLISGLCLGVLVAEASRARSGSLITARLAAEQGRNVYAPSPNALRAPCREGTKKLLLDGARPVSGAADILADLLPHLQDSLKHSPAAPTRGRPAEETQPAPAKHDALEEIEEIEEASPAQPESLRAPATDTSARPKEEPRPQAAALPAASPESEPPTPSNDDRASSRAETAAPERKEQRPARKAPAKKPARAAAPLTEEEETILALLQDGPLSQDELLYAAQAQSGSWNSASVSAVLMILEVKKLARRLSDSRYEARA
ncbi:DNA-processing protein DprA [uncultured Mailhella sp.]|uniref:DNA-processing protein DprA n=1 Tax=uncultured Mailhella sp. TaxID=1981031 RepID=UPI0025FBBEC7|nr:DNA-processing protein DprA [uncultured Mailhella sp.]